MGEARLDSGRTVFHLLGIPWKLTPAAWLFLPTRVGMGLTLALLFLPHLTLVVRLGYGLCFALATVVSQVVHIAGHTLGGYSVGAPMAANLILGTKILTHYPDDPSDLPDRTHLLRAIGGPLANLALGLVAAVGWNLVPNPILLFAAAINFVLGAVIILPVPGLDGEVVWRVLRRRSGGA